MDKNRKLERISREIEKCKICKENKSGKPVAGEGNPNAEIVFIGEAPGKKEAQVGRPFVGRSGQLFRSLIREIGLKEEDVYITSPVKYLPDYGTPTKEDILHGKIHLDKQLKIISPKIIVLLGSVAVRGVMGKKIPVLSFHGSIMEKDNKKYYITLHPAAALRFIKNKTILLSDFQRLKKVIQ